ncbi:hypothetical protein J2S74_002614 [Evansella vedderi]|uniref:Uncharacterized protein n=1 Tax=Evansella vedderi TaxID=38282 RepID=A0ABT9ZVG4_9BACI|nr:hypothetical protein [Evansella vedderi]MDQ0255232.1 hypothetical protein [Evansella vedderi]
MSWREHIWEQKWLEPLLPNYLKPLNDPAIETEDTREFVQEAVEFLSDLTSLSELPRLNKTFKRTIKGFLFKIKIKQKKIHVELIDTKKTSASIKKRVYITIFRKQFKSEKGMGKCIDSTIYYQVENRTIVRNIRKHPLFQPIFIKIHQLDRSLSGEKLLPEETESFVAKEVKEKKQSVKINDEQRFILNHMEQAIKKYEGKDELIETKLRELQYSLNECIKEVELLDIEERHHIKRLVSHDLPNLLETYLSLTENQKKKSYDEVIYSIHSMRTYIENQAKHLHSSRMDRMKQLLHLNRLRYETKKMDED